jgi:hypothetical protein
MDSALKSLVKKIPPPPDPRFRDVDWASLESAVGLSYPPSFKEFIGVYGGSVWFDNICPFYTEAKTDKEVKDFLRSVRENLKTLEGNLYDEHFTKVEMPLYPEEGGLFPFMVDYSSNLFCWETERKDPDKWPVVCWLRGPVVVLENTTIARMILDFLERKPHTIKIWGDINLYEPERKGLTETTEPKKSEKPKKKRK